MMMIVDTNKASIPFGDVSTELNKMGEEIGVKITCQHEDIFNKMHRI
jgi:ACT domain-containing protein